MEALQKQLKANGAWDQIARSLAHVIKNQPKNALEIFESICLNAKGAQIKGTTSPLDEKQLNSIIEKLQLHADLLRKPPANSEEEEAKAPPDDMPGTGDVAYRQCILESAGVCLGKEESYLISVSIHNFILNQAEKENNFKSVRFVGKVLGTKADYYIIECSKEDWGEPAEGEPPLAEPMGTGLNEFQYWASNTAGHPSSWSPLPPITPEQLAVAMRVRRFFSGNLNAMVAGYPYFPWKEAGYLRAQLARILHSTVVSPKNLWIIPEDAENAKPEQNPGYIPAPASELLSAKGWNHHRAYIMPEYNMCSPPAQEGEDEEDKKGNPVASLSDLSSDPRSKGKWRFSLCQNSGVRPELDANATVCAQSLEWPGAFCVSKGKTIINVYVGNGFCKLNKKYTRPAPPVPSSEFKLATEQEDPVKEEQPEAAAEEEKTEEKTD